MFISKLAETVPQQFGFQKSWDLAKFLLEAGIFLTIQAKKAVFKQNGANLQNIAILQLHSELIILQDGETYNPLSLFFFLFLFLKCLSEEEPEEISL